MFDLASPLGAIKTTEGELSYGNVGPTDCVYLRCAVPGEMVPCVVYAPDELDALLRIVEKGVELQRITSPGSSITLGCMRPKPISLRLTLVHPNQDSPFLLLRFFQGNWTADIQVEAAALATLLKSGVSKGNPSSIVHGLLKRRPEGGWRVSGKDLALVDGLSPGIGRLGEYLHPDEVPEGEVLEIWTFPKDGLEFVATFRTRERWRAPTKVEQREGQDGDLALFNGEILSCREYHESLGRKLGSSARSDTAWAAKIALSSLLCDILAGDPDQGQDTWQGRSTDTTLQTGVKALNAGQVSNEDLLLYQQVSCYFHSLSPKVADAQKAIDTTMSKTFEAVPFQDLAQRRLILNNWFLYLGTLHDGAPPEGALKAWSSCETHYRGTVVPKALCYPPPHPWNIDWNPEAVKPMAVQSASKPASPKRSKLPLVLALVLVPIILGVLYLSQQDSGIVAQATPGDESTVAVTLRPTPTGSPTVVVKDNGQPAKVLPKPTVTPKPKPVATPKPVVTPKPKPVAIATPKPVPKPVVTPKPKPVPTPEPTPEPAAALPELEGAWTIAGIDPATKRVADRGDMGGFKPVGIGPNWARFQKGETVLLVGFTRPSMKVIGYQSDVLFVNGKEAVGPKTAATAVALVGKAAESVSAKEKDEIVVLEGLGGRPTFRRGTVDGPMSGQPPVFDLINAYENDDLEEFKALLNEGNVNTLWNDGRSLLEIVSGEYARRDLMKRKSGDERKADYVRAVIEAGADVKKYGSKALAGAEDAKTQAVLTQAGAK